MTLQVGGSIRRATRVRSLHGGEGNTLAKPILIHDVVDGVRSGGGRSSCRAYSASWFAARLALSIRLALTDRTA